MAIYLGLGSNLGDRENYLRSAVVRLGRAGIETIRSASVYLTEPRDYADQPWFLNTVIQVNTHCAPEELIELCLNVEGEAGRIRTEPNGPRTLDIDILLYDSQIRNTAQITIPHPRFAERRFVLAPLAEIAPDVVDPRTGVRVTDLLERCADASSVEVHGPPLL